MYDSLTYPHVKIYFIDGPHRESYEKKRLFFQAGLLNGCTKVYIFIGRTLNGSFKSSSYLLIPSLTLGFFSTHPLSLLMSSLSPLLILLSLSLTPGRESGGGWRSRGEGDEGRRQQRPAGAERRWRGPGRVAMAVPRPDLAVAAGGARPRRRQRWLLTGGAW